MTTTINMDIECEITGTCENPALPSWHYAHRPHGITVRAVLELQLTPDHTDADRAVKHTQFGSALQEWAGRMWGEDLNGVMRIPNMSLERMAIWIFDRWARHYRDLVAVRLQDSQNPSVWVTYQPTDGKSATEL